MFKIKAREYGEMREAREIIKKDFKNYIKITTKIIVNSTTTI